MKPLPFKVLFHNWFPLLLVGLALVLTGCGSAATTAAPAPGQPSPRATARLVVTLPATVTITPTPTVTPLPKLNEPLVWLVRGQEPDGLPRVSDELNRLLQARGFNARVEIRPVEPAGYERQAEQCLAGGEPCDLVSLSAEQASLLPGKGLLLPLNAYPNPALGREEDLLQTQAPGLWAALPAPAWQAAAGLSLGDGKVGAIYAVPNQQAWVRPRGVLVRQDVLKALELQDELEEAQSYAELTPIFAAINEALRNGQLKEAGFPGAENLRRVLGQADLLHPHDAGYDPLGLPFVVRYDDPQARVQNWYETPAFMELAALRREWQVAGFAPETPLTPDEVQDGYLAGRYAAVVGVPVWPGSAQEWQQRTGSAWVAKPIGPAFLAAAAPAASAVGVNARIAAEPERVRRVMWLLELLHTDPEVLNLIAYGMEGRDWAWVDPQQQAIRRMPGSDYVPDFLDQLGNRLVLYGVGSEDAAAWQEAGRWNDAAPLSPALGFSFDPRPVYGEWVSVQGLLYEASDALVHGQAQDVEKDQQRLLKTLERVGLETVEEEVIRQFEAWQRKK